MFTHTNSQMNSFMMVSFIFWMAVLSSTSQAYVINCSPVSVQDQMNPGVRQLCAVLDSTIDLTSPPAYSGLLGESISLPNDKKLDHSFLRIGKRFHL
ncbi:uncharacterized protein [Leptinotarsa decemlineata]|uniref:uncharacterized protein n=1 Tax=Leptinotarsa decemlineata TaxID=7539 RepID=UPI003D3066BB